MSTDNLLTNSVQNFTIFFEFELLTITCKNSVQRKFYYILHNFEYISKSQKKLQRYSSSFFFETNFHFSSHWDLRLFCFFLFFFLQKRFSVLQKQFITFAKVTLQWVFFLQKKSSTKTLGKRNKLLNEMEFLQTNTINVTTKKKKLLNDGLLYC